MIVRQEPPRKMTIGRVVIVDEPAEAISQPISEEMVADFVEAMGVPRRYSRTRRGRR